MVTSPILPHPAQSGSMGGTVNLRILSVQHDQHGLDEVERIADSVGTVADRLRSVPGVRAVLPLSTCNRVELIVDAPAASSEDLADALTPALDRAPGWNRYEDAEATSHLFRVCSGLKSMVVGEREIAGQIRRALNEVQDAGLSSTTLSVVVEEALRTSRRVGRETQLAGSGRSVVTEALDLIAPSDWGSQHVLLVGTGAFAGASLAALRARGAGRVRVHSASGRADDFARRHGVGVATDLRAALSEADLVITCRGTGTHAITVDDIADDARLNILDLSLVHDVEPAVADLPGIRVIDLHTLQRTVSPAWAADTAHAENIVAEGIAEAHARLHSRVLDPALVSLREAVLDLVTDEIDRLPQGRPLEVDDAARALRRLATRLLHVPSSRARIAAASGRTNEYLSAMAELYGIGGPDEALTDQQCPATGLRVADLEPDTEERAV